MDLLEESGPQERDDAANFDQVSVVDDSDIENRIDERLLSIDTEDSKESDSMKSKRMHTPS